MRLLVLLVVSVLLLTGIILLTRRGKEKRDPKYIPPQTQAQQAAEEVLETETQMLPDWSFEAQ